MDQNITDEASNDSAPTPSGDVTASIEAAIAEANAESLRAMPAQSTLYTKPKSRGILSTIYLPEYFVMLVVLSALLLSVTYLLGTGIESLINKDTSGGVDSSAYYFDFSSFGLVTSLSTLLIALPIFILLFIRTKKVESLHPKVVLSKWRRAFLSLFLVVQFLIIFGNLTTLSYKLVARAIDLEDSYWFSSATDTTPWWQLVFVSVLSISVVLSVSMLMARDYYGNEETK